MRRIALGRAAGLVVQSENAEAIALGPWQQPIGRVRRFAPGIQMVEKRSPPLQDALMGVIKREGENWIGTHALTGSTTQAGRLLGSLSELPDNWHLVCACDAQDREILRELAEEKEVSHRTHIVHASDLTPEACRLFDIYVDTGGAGPFPIKTLCAMAGGVAVLGHQDSELGSILPESGTAHLMAVQSESDLTEGLWKLVGDDALRSRLGKENQIRAEAEFSMERSVDRYRRLYEKLLKQEIA